MTPPSYTTPPSMFVKFLILVLMSGTGTAVLILIRWTRVMATDKYITTVAVAILEVIKFILAFGILVWQNRSLLNSLKMIKLEAIDRPIESLKMAVPSCLYAVQNNMFFIALSNLDVPIQQILSQLKIPATALCSVFFLGKSLSYQQWTACFLVFAGLALVEYNPDSPYKSQSPNPDQNVYIGVGAVMIAVFCSAFAGVYFEKMVKATETSLWIRNLQMYFWTIIASFFGVVTKDLDEIKEKGFFFAYTPIVWVLLIIGAINGILISMVLKYADNIVKGFAASVSIILSTIISYFLFQYNFSAGFVAGGLIVCLAICLYGIPLPFLSTKWTSTKTNKKLSGPKYDSLRFITEEDDEINAN